MLREGSGVTLTRGDIHYVVTEFGIAYLCIEVWHGRFLDHLMKSCYGWPVTRAWMEVWGRALPHVILEVFCRESGSERRYPDGSNHLYDQRSFPDFSNFCCTYK